MDTFRLLTILISIPIMVASSARSCYNSGKGVVLNERQMSTFVTDGVPGWCIVAFVDNNSKLEYDEAVKHCGENFIDGNLVENENEVAFEKLIKKKGFPTNEIFWISFATKKRWISGNYIPVGPPYNKHKFICQYRFQHDCGYTTTFSGTFSMNGHCKPDYITLNQKSDSNHSKVCHAREKFSNPVDLCYCQKNHIQWTEWSMWSSCPGACGSGNRIRDLSEKYAAICNSVQRIEEEKTCSHILPCERATSILVGSFARSSTISSLAGIRSQTISNRTSILADTLSMVISNITIIANTTVESSHENSTDGNRSERQKISTPLSIGFQISLGLAFAGLFFCCCWQYILFNLKNILKM